MLQSVQANTSAQAPVEHGGWRAWLRNQHVRTELNALLFLLLAVACAMAGLHIAPAVFIVLALLLFGCDIYSCFRKDR